MDFFKKIGMIAKNDPDRLCIVKDSKKYSYGEFFRVANDIAERLSSIGSVMDKVLIYKRDCLEQFLYFFGASMAGKISILCPPTISNRRLNYMIEKIQPKIIINDNFELPADKSKVPLPDKKDIFLGALSSGTTGEEKIIWRDWASWTEAFPVQSKIFGIHEKSRLFIHGPFSYTANLNSALHILSEGGSIVLTDKNRPSSWVHVIKKYGVNVVFMVPAYYRMMVKYLNEPLKDIESVVTGGAKLDFETACSLFKMFPNAKITEYYGASELSYVTYNTGEDVIKKNLSVGKPFPGVEIWIKEGEVWVKSPYIAPDYRPQATVGDIGYMDSEGFLYLEGRRGNVINKGGQKIFPERVERILLKNPKIENVAIIGVDDQLKGQEVLAMIVKKDKSLTISEVRDFCRTNLEVYERPSKIMFVNDLPLNSNGKVDKRRIKSQFLLDTDNIKI